MNLLILGGTTEGAELARALAGGAQWNAVLSLAGRTREPAALPLPCRVGGFGGVSGLAGYLREQRIFAVIDATHPFATQMTGHAAEACKQVGVPLIRVNRPAWRPRPGDRWHEVPSMQAAADALGPDLKRVLLTVGRKDLAPFSAGPRHDYLIRSVDPPDAAALPEGARVIAARGPFQEEDERALLARERIEVVVTKNSGGTATQAKLHAARALDLPVILIARPAGPDGLEEVATSAEALAWLGYQRALRGE